MALAPTLTADAGRAAALRVAFGRALDLHRNGALNEAEQIYRSILAVEPGHAETTGALGAIFLQRGQFAAAERQLGLAIGLNPGDASAHLNRALALSALGRYGEALASCDRALALDPDLTDAHCNRGLVLRELNRLDESLGSFDRAVALRPDFADALTNRGVVLKELGRLTEALESFDRALALNPDSCETHNNRGLVLGDLERFDAALASLDRAIALKPDYAEAHNNRGLILDELERFDEALASFKQAMAMRQNSADILYNTVLPLTALNRLDEALAACNEVIAAKPDLAGAYHNRGRVLDDLSRPEEALANFDAAIALQPNNYDFYVNRALTKLHLGRFDQGWLDYEHRWRTTKSRTASRANIKPDQLAFGITRQELRGKRVLVVAEQGIGDEIMFSSMIPELICDTRSVTLECDSRLAALFTRSFSGIGIIHRRADPIWLSTDFDCLLPMASLGRLYRTSRHDFPLRDGYLTIDRAIAERWKERLGDLGGRLKVGVSWRGGTKQTNRGRRSILLESLRPLLDLDAIDFVSLQYGDAKAEIDTVNAQLPRPIINFGAAEIDDFDQLAGLVSTLDLVISVQTSLVHLSGAIGHPCWVLVPKVAEWRYGAEGTSMPWYRSVKLYRQDGSGEWEGTIARVAADLAQRASSDSRP